ncbi:MAG: 2-phosphosulfolactate phosphatase [Candidatus Hatepunaea meridiana]|nr:2-phosphosulfolactate phosphatase [Candidatus Hatepunaea meridiana]
MVFNQYEFNIRCEWGEKGAELLSPISDAVIIVDVMSFSTAVTIAVAKGATVFPYRWKCDSRVAFAKSVDAKLAGPRGKGKYSLSPLSLMTLKAGNRIVLPSPNGSTLSHATGDTPTFAGCLRNAMAVAKAAMAFGPQVSIIACGERWKEDDSLRPAYEDLLGAGSVISYLDGTCSPEAKAAVAVFKSSRSDLLGMLEKCSSGKQLIEKGFGTDIPVIAALNCDGVAPMLKDGAYVMSEQAHTTDRLLRSIDA